MRHQDEDDEDLEEEEEEEEKPAGTPGPYALKF